MQHLVKFQPYEFQLRQQCVALVRVCRSR
jgi:hypothetical protein